MLSNYSNAQEENKMDIIYVCHFRAINRYIEYKIDLKNKIFWKYNMAEHNLERRNETAKNEGYDFAGNLTDDKITAFVSEANKNLFGSWKKIYTNPDVDGGHWWSIEITFKDRAVKQISGSNAYPKTWNGMNLALKHLTGEDDILGSIASNEWTRIYDGEDK
jgi:hypothetical protein